MNKKIYLYRVLTWHGEKLRRYMVAYENATCDTRVHVCACVRMFAINENKHPFHDFRYLISRTLLIYPSDFNYFHHVRLFLLFLGASDVAKCGAFDHMI